MIRVLVVILALGVGAAIAQQGSILEPELDLNQPDDLGAVEAVEAAKAATAPGAVLRGLDKVSGGLTDIELATGQTRAFGRLEITLGECRYPAGNPSGDAYAFVVIRKGTEPRPVFEGWMIASSPALNALDDARYDVWVLRCTTS